MRVSYCKTGALWRVLRIIDRSILPRIVRCRAASGQLHLDVASQRVALCPRIDDAFILDDVLEQEAPVAFEFLRRGPEAVTAAALNEDREPLLRHWARALVRFNAGAVDFEYSVQARTAGATGAGGSAGAPSFHVLELAAAVTPLLCQDASGLVPAFYHHLRGNTPDAWLFERSGWPSGFPAEAELGKIEDMAKAAHSAEVWREHLAVLEGPLMGVFIGSSREPLRCIAADETHIALLTAQGSELGSLLAGWRAAERSGRVNIEHATFRTGTAK